MKTFLGWIVAIALVGVIALAAAGYLAYRAARPALETARGYVGSFGQQLDDLDKKVVNQTTFSAPARGELSKDQVERFARVQHGVRAALGQRVREIEEKYRNLKFSVGSQQPPSATELMSALSELSGILVDARRMQVDAINQEKFSAAEYDWVRKQFYQAAGVNSVNRRLGELQKMMMHSSNDGVAVTEPTVVNAPDINRELVKPYQRFIDDWLPLLFFGL